ncbi:MAG: hypothetical protein IKX94_03540 [Muribaculaceae bacterium]|nr:hypothetical protein [Muribaculaceae bacterium]MBR5744381.1 hypothetical protein [Muribaculaceae bacterium]
MKILGYILLALGTLLLLLALLPMFDFNVTRSVVSSSILVILVGLLLVYMGHLNDNEKGGKGD